MTPFTAAGTVDRVGLANLVCRQLAAGTRGISIGGSTGESGSQRDAERAEAIRTVAAGMAPLASPWLIVIPRRDRQAARARWGPVVEAGTRCTRSLRTPTVPSGFMGLAFSYVTNNALVPADQLPRTALDFLTPRYLSKLTITWPNDDDAVRYMFKRIVDRYGWSYLDNLMARQPTFVRGMPVSVGAVSGGQAAASVAAFGMLAADPAGPTTFTPPSDFFQS
jgi:hypothetical protein